MLLSWEPEGSPPFFHTTRDTTDDAHVVDSAGEVVLTAMLRLVPVAMLLIAGCLDAAYLRVREHEESLCKGPVGATAQVEEDPEVRRRWTLGKALLGDAGHEAAALARLYLDLEGPLLAVTDGVHVDSLAVPIRDSRQETPLAELAADAVFTCQVQ